MKHEPWRKSGKAKDVKLGAGEIVGSSALVGMIGGMTIAPSLPDELYVASIAICGIIGAVLGIRFSWRSYRTLRRKDDGDVDGA